MENVKFEEHDGKHIAHLIGGVLIAGEGSTQQEALDRLIGYLNELHQKELRK